MVAMAFSLQKKRYKILKSNATNYYRLSSESQHLKKTHLLIITLKLVLPKLTWILYVAKIMAQNFYCFHVKSYFCVCTIYSPYFLKVTAMLTVSSVQVIIK